MSKELDNSLISNLHKQLNRLVEQLADLEAEKETLEEDEYKEMREDTIAQLEELNQSLNKLQEGNITLVDELSAARFAIRAAISAAFTPEVVALFVKKQPVALRQRLIALETDRRLGKVQKKEFETKKRELLMALQKLHDPLSGAEIQFLADTEEYSDLNFELTEASTNKTCTKHLLDKA